MKKLFLFLFVSVFAVSVSNAQQTTAMDFNMDDCNGNMHHLFSELDSNNVVILEFFMNCSSCITAGQKITVLYNQLNAEYPGRVRYYAFNYNDNFSCTVATNWVNNNNINAVPFDSGAVQVAYYGGFGMPTIAVVAGSQHSVLFSNVGFTTSDTTTMGTEIRNFFATTGIAENNHDVAGMQVFPSPASQNVTVRFDMKQSSPVTLLLVNPLGQVVRENAMGETAPGEHSVQLPVTGLPAGVYFVRMSTNEGVINRKLLINE